MSGEARHIEIGRSRADGAIHLHVLDEHEAVIACAIIDSVQALALSRSLIDAVVEVREAEHLRH